MNAGTDKNLLWGTIVVNREQSLNNKVGKEKDLLRKILKIQQDKYNRTTTYATVVTLSPF